MPISAFMFDMIDGGAYKRARNAAETELKTMAEAKIGPSQATDDGKRAYERSTIEFPYNDLDDAVGVAEAVHEKGGGSCTLEQLAAQLGMSATSGTFRGRVSNAGTFRLTINASGGARLTDLGRRIIDPNQTKAARVESFLGVPLYAKIFENYKKYLLPPPSALEREIVNLGVSSKQAGKARQAFMRSAEQAGFFEHGKDKLVLPAIQNSEDFVKPTEPAPQPERGGGDGGNVSLHPFIQGLLNELPGAGKTAGDVWPETKRKLWLTTAESIFKMIYKGSSEGTSEPQG